MRTLPGKRKVSGLTLIGILIMLSLLVGVHQAAAQGTRFFRISGPAATTIAAFRPDGSLVWSNALTGTNYTVQTVTALPGGTNWVDYVQLRVTNGVNTNLIFAFNPPAGMALIPAGVFTMGNSIGDSDITDANPTNVTVSAFYMDVNLVSYGQWQSVFNWATNNGYGFANVGAGRAANNPVQSINWNDAVKWCNARSQQAGLAPVYYTDAGLTKIYTNGSIAPYANWTNSGYRLPTEAEWEKAARGGLSGQRFPWGNTISESQANYYGDTYYNYDLGPNGWNATYATGGPPNPPNFYTSPVGSFAPNGYGLYDMAGNLFEWCWDWYGTPYGNPTTTNPTGPTTGNNRVLRGGDWGFDAGHGSRCAIRIAGLSEPAVPEDIGFRCVRGH